MGERYYGVIGGGDNSGEEAKEIARVGTYRHARYRPDCKSSSGQRNNIIKIGHAGTIKELNKGYYDSGVYRRYTGWTMHKDGTLSKAKLP